VTFWGYHTLAYALPAQILMIQRIWFPIQQQSYAPLGSMGLFAALFGWDDLPHSSKGSVLCRGAQLFMLIFINQDLIMFHQLLVS
jgi:hypothetical protein